MKSIDGYLMEIEQTQAVWVISWGCLTQIKDRPTRPSRIYIGSRASHPHKFASDLAHGIAARFSIIDEEDRT
jgi:hypothetical protein